MDRSVCLCAFKQPIVLLLLSVLFTADAAHQSDKEQKQAVVMAQSPDFNLIEMLQEALRQWL